LRTSDKNNSQQKFITWC